MFESSMSNCGSCSMVGQAWLFTMKFALSLEGQSGNAMPSQADCMAHSRDMLEESVLLWHAWLLAPFPPKSLGTFFLADANDSWQSGSRHVLWPRPPNRQ